MKYSLVELEMFSLPKKKVALHPFRYIATIQLQSCLKSWHFTASKDIMTKSESQALQKVGSKSLSGAISTISVISGPNIFCSVLRKISSCQLSSSVIQVIMDQGLGGQN